MATPPPERGTRSSTKVLAKDRGIKPRSVFPRKDFHLLSFPEGIPLAEKFQWRNKFLPIHHHSLSIPNQSKWWFNHLYVMRKNKHLIEELQRGVHGGLQFVSKDKPPLRTFFIKGFPTYWNKEQLHSLLENEDGKYIESLQRLKYDGKESSTLKMMWKSIEVNPPEEIVLLPGIKDPPILKVQEKSSTNIQRSLYCQKGHTYQKCSAETAGPITTTPRSRTCSRCGTVTENMWEHNCSQQNEDSITSESQDTGSAEGESLLTTTDEAVQVQIVAVKEQITAVNEQIVTVNEQTIRDNDRELQCKNNSYEKMLKNLKEQVATLMIQLENMTNESFKVCPISSQNDNGSDKEIAQRTRITRAAKVKGKALILEQVKFLNTADN
ncbi:hypothetical protein SK128_000676 [Halocaridina rubra]|uniref:Uncharacterized protein n=1 Tax=Halocaridina rubra TaxID=373956 RepID=A0AAN8X6R5_HALRR